MALTPSPVKITEVTQITPPSDSPESATELTLPLTFFDTLWFKFHPVERIFFYKLTAAAADSSFFNSSILPKLKHSLSLTLLHFLPLAGNLIWPSDSPKPFILYTFNDAVSFIVAESDADFHLLSGDSIRDAADSHHYVPELSVSDTKSSIVSFQITLFPNKGFSIGVSSHHAISDGKSITMFIKAWAHISKHGSASLPPEHAPFLDRKIIEDPDGIDMVYLDNWITLASKSGADPNPKCLKLLPIGAPSDIKLVRGTFRLSGDDVKKLRRKVISSIGEGKYSTFVITYAYVAFNIVKSKGLQGNTILALGFMVDCRSRLNPPVPENYFGNCVFPHGVLTEAGLVREENGFVFLVEKLKETMKRIEEGVIDGAKNVLSDFMMEEPGLKENIGVAGSTRFDVYASDFGWGKPEKVEVTSVDRTGSFSMAESKYGNGVEIGLAMTVNEMEIFSSLFVNGLN